MKIDLERSDILSILIYVLIKANIEDLRGQLALITDFTSTYIQDGYSRISSTYSDFKNSVDFISNLDI